MTNKKNKPNKQTPAQRHTFLLRKYKKLIFNYYRTAEFKEPILFLIRKTNKVEFYDKASSGRFEYKHSDGTTRYILLNNNLLEFDYGPKKFRGYIIHEDYPLPLPQTTATDTESISIGVEKVIHDVKKWKAQEYKAKGEFIWKIGAAIALVIIAYSLYVILRPEDTPQAAQTAIQFIQQNATRLG